MALSTWVYGVKAKLVALVDSFWQMGMCMKENGKTTKLMAMECITTLMEQSTKDTGSMTSKRARAKSNGLTIVAFRALTKMARSMAKEGSFGLMVHATKEIGSTTRCMGRACLPGLMVGDMKAPMRMIRSMAMVFSHGLTAAGLKACGGEENR
jgi:hypothetical protein